MRCVPASSNWTKWVQIWPGWSILVLLGLNGDLCLMFCWLALHVGCVCKPGVDKQMDLLDPTVPVWSLEFAICSFECGVCRVYFVCCTVQCAMDGLSLAEPYAT